VELDGAVRLGLPRDMIRGLGTLGFLRGDGLR